jgi:hypothetical protein
MICQQVTLSGDAEWPKVADAVIEADIGVWPLPPPGLDDRLIGGGIFDAVGCTGMFADRQSKAAAGGLD